MREILFRGKRKDNGKWVQGFYIHHRNAAHYIIDVQHGGYEDMNGEFFVPRWYQVDPETVSEFISMTDKNGKRIFEGDIVRHRDNVYVISYITKYSRFAGTMPGCVMAVFNLFTCEVIGNIHDNPELIGEREDNGDK